MKAYKLEVLVIDFENYGEEDIKTIIERAKYVNADVKSIKSADIGEWSDDHKLNMKVTCEQAYKDLEFK